MLLKNMKLKAVNSLIQKNKELIARSKKIYLNTARLAKSNNSVWWTPAEHREIQNQLRHALAQTKLLEKKVVALSMARPHHAAVSVQSAWRGFKARQNAAGSRRPQVPHRSNYNRRLRRSSRPQAPPS